MFVHTSTLLLVLLRATAPIEEPASADTSTTTETDVVPGVGDAVLASVVNERVDLTFRGSEGAHVGIVRAVGDATIVFASEDGSVVELPKDEIVAVRLMPPPPVPEPPQATQPAELERAEPRSRPVVVTLFAVGGVVAFAGLVTLATGLGYERHPPCSPPRAGSCAAKIAHAHRTWIAGAVLLPHGVAMLVAGGVVHRVGKRRQSATASRRHHIGLAVAPGKHGFTLGARGRF